MPLVCIYHAYDGINTASIVILLYVIVISARLHDLQSCILERANESEEFNRHKFGIHN